MTDTPETALQDETEGDAGQRHSGELSAPKGNLAFFLDLDPPTSDFRQDVHEGLSLAQKQLSPKYLYDERGSSLFQSITELATYYPTRVERALFDRFSNEIAGAVGPRPTLLEYGAGSPDKIARLLSLFIKPSGYVAVDISRDFLLSGMDAFAGQSDVPVGAVAADFTTPFTLPMDYIDTGAGMVGVFLGSTIGNLTKDVTLSFLRAAGETLGPRSKLLIAVDLEKDEGQLATAYNEPEGVTAQFISNVLPRMQRELGAELNTDHFSYHISFGSNPQAVEMFLKAGRETTISLDEKSYAFEEGETLMISQSRKYSLPGFEALLDDCPWRLQHSWNDTDENYAVTLLERD